MLVKDLRHLHHHRPLDDEGPVLTPPPQHTLWLLKRAAAASESGEWNQILTELCHAVLVALEKGPQGVSMHEYVMALRGVAGWGFPFDDPDRGEAA